MKTKKSIPFVKVKICKLNSNELNVIHGGNHDIRPKSKALKVCNSKQC